MKDLSEFVDGLGLNGFSDDGDTIMLDNEHRIRLSLGPDYYSSVESEGEFYGIISWERIDAPRPKEFDGNSEVILVDYPTRCWWQPPTDVKRDTEAFRNMRSALLAILHYGFSTVGVIYEELCDMGHFHESDAAFIGGIEPLATHDELVDIIREQIYEVLVGKDLAGA